MNDKLRKRISNLLSLAENDAATANEAAIALRRARILMDDHQIDLDDLKQSQFEHVIAPTKARHNYPLWQQTLASEMARLNDCRVKRHWNKDYESSHIEFYGLEGDALTASLMYAYIYRSIHEGARRFLEADGRKQGKVKRRNAFQLGYVAAIGQRVEEILDERNKSIVGKGMIISKQAMMDSEYGKIRGAGACRSIPKKLDMEALRSGYNEGMMAPLDRSMTSDETPGLPLAIGHDG